MQRGKQQPQNWEGHPLWCCDTVCRAPWHFQSIDLFHLRAHRSVFRLCLTFSSTDQCCLQVLSFSVSWFRTHHSKPGAYQQPGEKQVQTNDIIANNIVQFCKRHQCHQTQSCNNESTFSRVRVESESCKSRIESESYWAGLESESSRFRVWVQVFVARVRIRVPKSGNIPSPVQGNHVESMVGLSLFCLQVFQRCWLGELKSDLQWCFLFSVNLDLPYIKPRTVSVWFALHRNLEYWNNSTEKREKKRRESPPKTCLFQLHTFCIKFGHLGSKFPFCLCQLDFLRCHNFDDTIIHVHRSHPFAKTFTGFGCVFDDGWFEIRVGHEPWKKKILWNDNIYL